MCSGILISALTLTTLGTRIPYEYFNVNIENNIGMTADAGTFARLVKLIPEGYVREMAYTGRRISASEAKSMGLVNNVYPDQDNHASGSHAN